jgi:hypothetical protein
VFIWNEYGTTGGLVLYGTTQYHKDEFFMVLCSTIHCMVLMGEGMCYLGNAQYFAEIVHIPSDEKNYAINYI